MPETLEFTVDKFTFKVTGDRRYTPEGVWCLAAGRTVRIGLSDFLQQRSGDVAFAEVKPAGTLLGVGDEVASIETIKVNLVVASPAAGTVERVNPRIAAAPEIINQDPYGEGWLCEIETSDWETAQNTLLDSAAYTAQIKAEAESEDR